MGIRKTRKKCASKPMDSKHQLVYVWMIFMEQQKKKLQRMEK
jgi:hypothetical protein